MTIQARDLLDLVFGVRHEADEVCRSTHRATIRSVASWPMDVSNNPYLAAALNELARQQ